MFAQTLAIGMPGMFEWIIIGGIGLLIFGKRLPEVGRSLGKGIVEFKKGLKGIEEEVSAVDHEIDNRPAAPRKLPEPTGATPAYKFDPHTGQPVKSETSEAKFDPYTGEPVKREEDASTTHS
jgi:sec-independent protein translocase protein TatA